MYQVLWAVVFVGALLFAVAVVLFMANVAMSALAQANATLYQAVAQFNRTAPYAVKVQQVPQSQVYNWLAQNIGVIALAVAGAVVVAALLHTRER